MANNPQIIEVISQHTIGASVIRPALNYHTNIVDLGIIPINMQMIKKDVGLFNIFLNSSLYKEYLSHLELSAKPDFLTNIDTLGLLQVDHAQKKNIIQLLTAESYLHKYLSREL